MKCGGTVVLFFGGETLAVFCGQTKLCINFMLGHVNSDNCHSVVGKKSFGISIAFVIHHVQNLSHVSKRNKTKSLSIYLCVC